MKKSVILCFCNVVLSLVLTLACIQAVPVQALSFPDLARRFFFL